MYGFNTVVLQIIGTTFFSQINTVIHILLSFTGLFIYSDTAVPLLVWEAA